MMRLFSVRKMSTEVTQKKHFFTELLNPPHDIFQQIMQFFSLPEQHLHVFCPHPAVPPLILFLAPLAPHFPTLLNQFPAFPFPSCPDIVFPIRWGAVSAMAVNLHCIINEDIAKKKHFIIE